MNVAIKSFYPELELFTDFQREFRAELMLMGMIRHEGFLEFYGGLSVKPDFFFVSKLMDRNLYELLRDTSTPLSMSIKLRMVYRISKSIAYLHSLHVVHRDLKSMNVLVGTDPVDIVLCDFGSSRDSQELDG